MTRRSLEQALKTWEDKLIKLETELAITDSAGKKFELEKGIEECQKHINRLTNRLSNDSPGRKFELRENIKKSRTPLRQIPQENFVQPTRQHRNSRENAPTKKRITIKTLFSSFSAIFHLKVEVFILLFPIILIWFFVGKSGHNYEFSNNFFPLLSIGASGGVSSGFLIGLTWKIVATSIKWEEALLICLPVGTIAGGFIWATIGGMGGTTMLRDNGQILGLIVGVAAYFCTVLWLSRLSSQA